MPEDATGEVAIYIPPPAGRWSPFDRVRRNAFILLARGGRLPGVALRHHSAPFRGRAPGLAVHAVGRPRPMQLERSAGLASVAVEVASWGKGGLPALNIAARALTLTAGTLDADTYDVTAGSLASSNSNTRTLDLGSGTWTLSATGTAWDLTTATGLTLTAGTSTVTLTDPDVTFAGGGKTYNVVELARGGTVAITGSNTFATLRLAA